MRKLTFLLFFLSTVVQEYQSLKCYVCDKTKEEVHRFTGETKNVLVCTQDPSTWSIQTCSNEREYCHYSVEKQGYLDYTYFRGCGIPDGRQTKIFINGNVISWNIKRKCIFFQIHFLNPLSMTLWNQGVIQYVGTREGKVDTMMVQMPVFVKLIFVMVLIPNI